MKKAQLIGGTIILALAALIFVLTQTSGSIPAAITLTIVGIVTVTSTRKNKDH